MDILQQEKINYKDYVIRFLTGNASWQLYYILVLMQLVLLTPVIFKLLDKTIWRLILYAITPIHISVVYFLNLSTSQNVGTYATLFSAWILFYLVGLDARAGRLDRLVQNIKFWHVMVSLLFSVSEALFLFHIVGEPASITFSQIRFFNCLYGVVLILWLMKIRENASKINIVQKWWYRIGCTLGDESYGIFFCHIAVLFVVTTFLRIIGFDKVWSVYWLLSWIIILFGSLGLVKMGAFVFKKLNMRWVIMALGLE